MLRDDFLVALEMGIGDGVAQQGLHFLDIVCRRIDIVGLVFQVALLVHDLVCDGLVKRTYFLPDLGKI